MMNNNRVLVICLDGATFDVLTPLMKAGYMPFLNTLISDSSSTRLTSTIPPITPVAWASFMTGKLPHKHGIIDFRQYDPYSHEESFVNSRSINSKTIWNIITESGVKGISVNLPLTYPPYPINGIMVSGFDTPSVSSQFTFPPEFQDEIMGLIPDYDFILSEEHDYRTERQFDNFLKAITRAFEQRCELAAHLLEKEKDWRLFVLQFQNVDHLQHRMWNYIYPCEFSGQERKMKVYACFQKLDSLLERLFGLVDSKDTVKVIFSDHGFGEAYYDLYPNNLLIDLGLLTVSDMEINLNDSKEDEKITALMRRGIKELNNIIKKKIDKGKNPVHRERHLNRMRNEIFLQRMPLDWKKTKAYVPTAEVHGFLYLNSVGREPQAIVNDNERDQLMQFIMEKFKDIRDPFSGKQLIRDVLHGKDVFPDAGTLNIPDLVLAPEPGVCIKSGILRSGYLIKSFVKGTHREDGIFIINNKTKIRADFQTFTANIIDLAPTILYMLGLPVPKDMDGRVLQEVFIQGDAVKYQEGDTSISPRKKPSYSDEEEAQITERLKNLGYL